MLNRSILIGRLTKEPELRYTSAGVAVTQFTLAVDRPFKNNQTGEKEADFIPIVVWRDQAEHCANYLRKGSLCAVDGRMQTRNYDNNEGRKVYVTEVVADSVRFLDRKREDGQQTPQQGNQGGGRSFGGNNDPFKDDGKPIDISNDDLPF